MEITELYQETYELRALLASALVGVACGVLGCFIVLRNMALIGDALSHAILPGVVAAFVIAGHSILAFFIGSVAAGLITAVLITWIQRNLRAKEDSAIGIVFSVMFAAGVIGISYVTRQEGVHLDMKDFLFGNILGVSNQDLLLTGVIAAYVLVCIAAFYRYFMLTTFQSVVAKTMGVSSGVLHYFLMLLLSFTVVASLQSVGVILVVAMLVIPASTAYLLARRLQAMLIWAGVVGLLSATLGLTAAILFNTTPGPAMTVTAGILYGLAACFAPRRGLVLRALARRKKRFRIQDEDALKRIAVRAGMDDETLFKSAGELGVGEKALKRSLRRLLRANMIVRQDGKWKATPEGKARAYQLVRAHRVWETYMVERLGQDAAHIHPSAERLEHFLTEEMIRQVDAELGFPKQDPHGSAIPQRPERESLALSDLKPGQRALVTTPQPDSSAALRLWEMGVTPNYPLALEASENGAARIAFEGKTYEIEAALARKIRVAPFDPS